MVKLPASECGADHRDSAGALGHTAPAYRGFIRPELRTGTVAGEPFPTREMALQDRNCRRVFEAQGLPIEQGGGEVWRLGGHSTIHWKVVEPDGDAGPERFTGSMGATLLY